MADKKIIRNTKNQKTLLLDWDIISCGCLLLIVFFLLVLIGAVFGIKSGDIPPGQGGGTLRDDCKDVPASAKQYIALVNKYAQKYKLDPAFVAAVIEQESTWNPRAYRYEPAINDSSYGLMQTLLGTAKGMGYSGNGEGLYDPETSINYGTKYLSQMYFSNNNRYDLALGAYNGGPGCVRNGTIVCPAALGYSAKVMSRYQKYVKCLQQISSGGGGVLGNMPYYNQYKFNDSSIAKSGCGPTTLAMMAGYCGRGDLTPPKLFYYPGMMSGGFQVYKARNIMNTITGKPWVQANSWDEIVAQVKSGNPVAVATGFSGASGHWMVITGFTENGDVIVNDPAGDHGNKYTGHQAVGPGGDNGQSAVYDLQDFRNNFDLDPDGGNAQYSLYVQGGCSNK